MKKHKGSPAPRSAGSQLPRVRREMAAHWDLGIGTYSRCKERRVLPCLISHRGWPGHPLAFVFMHLSDLQDLPTPPGFFVHSSFYFFFSDAVLLTDHFSGEPFCWAFSSFCNLRSPVFTIPPVCACSLSPLVVLSRLFTNWIYHSYVVRASSKFATSSYWLQPARSTLVLESLKFSFGHKYPQSSLPSTFQLSAALCYSV